MQYKYIPAVLLSVSMLILMVTSMGHCGLMLYLVNLQHTSIAVSFSLDVKEV